MPLAPLSPDRLAALEAHLPPDTLRPAAPRYLEEPRGLYHGHAAAIALPRSTDEVAEIVRFANDGAHALVPYGGGTGLVGGQVAGTGPAPLVVSLERMNSVRAIHPAENVVIAQAGVILQDLHNSAAIADRLFPLSLASQGSAQIGGLLSTNAGGVNVLRYGNTRDLCLGLEVVLPDGRIWNGLSRLRKDNTGYDLRDLMIGAEGTLGIITAAALKLFSPPAATGAALLITPSPETALHLLALARSHVGECVSAFELLHRTGFDFLTDVLPDLRQPWDTPPEWSVLIELGLPRGLDADESLAEIFADAHEKGLVTDGVIAQNETQANDFWNLREHIPEANRRIGAISSHDISLPLGAVPAFIENATQALCAIAPLRINCFGHLGDGNLHFNLFPPKGQERGAYAHLRKDFKAVVYDFLARYEGSISAEHGIGRAKANDLCVTAPPEKLSMMRAIKTALDPKGIMNPGVIFPV